MQNHTQKWLVVGLLGLCGLGGVAAVRMHLLASEQRWVENNGREWS